MGVDGAAIVFARPWHRLLSAWVPGTCPTWLILLVVGLLIGLAFLIGRRTLRKEWVVARRTLSEPQVEWRIDVPDDELQPDFLAGKPEVAQVDLFDENGAKQALEVPVFVNAGGAVNDSLGPVIVRRREIKGLEVVVVASGSGSVPVAERIRWIRVRLYEFGTDDCVRIVWAKSER